MSKSKDLVWYHKGLSFTCTECGQCCTGSPGYVWVNGKEIEEMSTFLKISKEEFVQKYTRKVGPHLALLEHPKNYDCVFLEGKKCKLYTSRPKQCRTFPWWPENLESKEAWEKEGNRCEGINHPEGKLFSQEEIDKHLS